MTPVTIGNFRCTTCKKIFKLEKQKTSLYEPNSFVRMAVCPFCKKPRQVNEIKKLSIHSKEEIFDDEGD